jgi:hypothetical protein
LEIFSSVAAEEKRTSQVIHNMSTPARAGNYFRRAAAAAPTAPGDPRLSGQSPQFIDFKRYWKNTKKIVAIGRNYAYILSSIHRSNAVTILPN